MRGHLHVLLFPPFRTEGRALLWPGLFSLAAGVWQFCENTLAVYLLQHPCLLYLFSFTALFSLVIPLYRAAMLILDMRENLLLRVLLYVQEASLLAALALAFAGILPLHRSLYYFHFLLPSYLLALALSILREAVTKKNRYATSFFAAFLVLTGASILELANYYFQFDSRFSVIFQLGLVAFTVQVGVLAGIYSRNLFQAKFRNLKLENSLALQAQTIEAQKSRNALLLSHYEEARRTRHDIRHHLRTLEALLDEGQYGKAREYISRLSDAVPVSAETVYCDNSVLNATLGYYVQSAKEEGVRCRVHAEIPASCPNISDAELCVIFGNLLENALEACRHAEPGKRFLSLSARQNGDMLFISLDNSLGGRRLPPGGKRHFPLHQAPGPRAGAFLHPPDRRGA